MTLKPRIFLLHATHVAMEPIADAMARLWPEAQPVNLLDDGLSLDRASEGDELSETLTRRFVALGRYGEKSGADGILVTCSAFGPAIDKMEQVLSIPVLRPNEAMFRAAISSGLNIGMLATFGPAVPTMEAEFTNFAAGTEACLETFVVPEAIDLLRKGGGDGHNRLIAESAPRFSGKDAIMLAHFSTSRAADAVRAKVSVPVHSAPDAAVLRMRELVTGQVSNALETAGC
jgi:aspartate/glutamate racemase